MPVPIKPILDLDRKTLEENYHVDYSFLTALPTPKKVVTASNNDATLLFDLWTKAEKVGEDLFKLDEKEFDNKDILRLKSRGFLAGNTKEVKFTKKAKMIVTTMALAEPNKFQKRQQRKPYNEILASMDKRGKKGYRIPKFASSTSNNLRLS